MHWKGREWAPEGGGATGRGLELRVRKGSWFWKDRLLPGAAWCSVMTGEPWEGVFWDYDPGINKRSAKSQGTRWRTEKLWITVEVFQGWRKIKTRIDLSFVQSIIHRIQGSYGDLHHLRTQVQLFKAMHIIILFIFPNKHLQPLAYIQCVS